MVLFDDLIDDLVNAVDLANDHEHEHGNDDDEEHCGGDQDGE